MAGTSALVLAGINGSGAGGTSLAWFAPTGTALPTSAGASLNVAFKDAGYVSDDGLTRNVDEDQNDIYGFGSGSPVRTIVNHSKVTFELVFLEHNFVSLSVYHRLPLTGGSALVVQADGTFSFTEGAHRSQRYAAIFDIVDGTNLYRYAVPNLEVTDRKENQWQAGEVATLGVTCTAYPGTDGVSVQHIVKIGGMGS